jgi:hypothetical protein
VMGILIFILELEKPSCWGNLNRPVMLVMEYLYPFV